MNPCCWGRIKSAGANDSELTPFFRRRQVTQPLDRPGTPTIFIASPCFQAPESQSVLVVAGQVSKAAGDLWACGRRRVTVRRLVWICFTAAVSRLPARCCLEILGPAITVTRT